MIARQILSALYDSLDNFPVVALIGSRQVGKTTLAKVLQSELPKKSIYLDLELISDLNKLNDAELYFQEKEDELIIIDEVQRKPELFSLIRALIDQKRTNARFLVLGSASPKLLKQASESLAGRIVYHEISPLFYPEIPTSQISQLWVRGGYPDSFLAKNDKISFDWRSAFIKTYLERDIPQLGFNISSQKLLRFLLMITHYHGQIWNASQIAKSLDLSANTVQNYLDIMESTFLVRRLFPYWININKRLIKSPKIYFRDSGIFHAMLNLVDYNQLSNHPFLGHSWECFVIEQIINNLPPYWQYYYYRTNAGAEIDLVLIPPQQEPIAVEIKYSSSPKLTKGLIQAYQDLNCQKGWVVYPGKEKYPLNSDFTALPLSQITTIWN